MNKEANHHPSEEQLMEAALENHRTGIEDHLTQCGECREAVKEFRTIRSTVAALDEEEVPMGVATRIKRISHGGHSINVAGKSSLGGLLSNPMVVAVITALVIVVICALVASVIFKG